MLNTRIIQKRLLKPAIAGGIAFSLLFPGCAAPKNSLRKIEIRAQQKPNTAEEIRKILSGTDIRTQRERERFINELQKRAGPNRNLTIEEFNSIVNEINRIIREERKKLDDEIRRKEFKEREKQRKLEEEQGITRVAKRKF